MTDRETFVEFWSPTVGREEAENLWQIKLDREANPIRSAAVYVMPSYQSPVTGKWIDTPAQRRDDLARTGSRPWEGMEQEKKEAARQRAETEKQTDALAEKMAVEAWQNAPQSVKTALGG